MNAPRRRLSLPSDRSWRLWRGDGVRILAFGLLLAMVLGAGVLAGRHWLAWREGQQPLSASQMHSIEALARGTQSPAVWALYRSEAAGGLTRAGAERVRDAAKAAAPPEGLLSN